MSTCSSEEQTRGPTMNVPLGVRAHWIPGDADLRPGTQSLFPGADWILGTSKGHSGFPIWFLNPLSI